jgi:hypothetical protein
VRASEGNSDGWDELSRLNANHITPVSFSYDMLLNSYWPQIAEKSRVCSHGVTGVLRFLEQQQLNNFRQVDIRVDVKDKLPRASSVLRLSRHALWLLCQPLEVIGRSHNILESCRDLIDILGSTPHLIQRLFERHTSGEQVLNSTISSRLQRGCRKSIPLSNTESILQYLQLSPLN